MSITSVVNLAAGKIGELLEKEVKFLYGVEGQVRSLQQELEMVQSFLIDMEAMDEEGGDERSRTTIKQIRKIAYDAEDAIESYILEAKSSPDKKEYFFKRYLCFCSSLSRTHQVGCEIEAITVRLNKTMEMWKKYVGELGVRIDARQGLNKKTRLKMRSIAYSHTREDHVVGLDEDINKLVGVLTDGEHTEIKVVSMVGMGGSGKTTLARKLYNHESVQKEFNCLAWVSVSKQWDAQHIILDLLKKVKGETLGTDEPSASHQVLVGKLYEYLEMKSYLIVLDDVWEAKALEDIRPALPIEGDGRKIIITTRKEEVVNYPDLKPLTYSHKPRRLTEEESWELFRKIALIHREEIYNSADIVVLEELGKKMLKKCRGLPLAVIALAGILLDKENLEEWEKVSKAVSSKIMKEGKGTQLYGPVNDMLALSYIDLPHELKPCFLYLARYPEDHNIHVGELIRTWVAEGFVTSTQQHVSCTLEDLARRYLDELVHRCLVFVSGKNYEGKAGIIQVHDLVRDLCIEKAKKEEFLELFTPKAPNLNATVTESRRAAFYSQDGNLLPFPTNSQHLRSLIYGADHINRKNQNVSLQPIHQNFKLLRVLILDGFNTCDGTLPVGIGSLIHLRYLGLRWTNIAKLPSSIGNLRNLQTLGWRDCHVSAGEIRIPDVLWKLEGLMHLFLPLNDGTVVDGKTWKLHTLKFLETLKMSSGGGNWMLEELPRLSPSVQKLSIHDIRSQEQLDAAFQCPSISSDRLHSLLLEWKDGITLENLEPIIHCQHLRRLILFGRMGDGLVIQFPACIKKLELRSTRFEEAALEALGKLPHLTIMVLLSKSYMGNQWTCSTGEFPQLRVIRVTLEDLEEWSIERGAMRQLKCLRMAYCVKLRKLPEGLKFITTLRELKVKGMGDEFMKRIEDGGEDALIIQHVSRVEIFPAEIQEG